MVNVSGKAEDAEEKRRTRRLEELWVEKTEGKWIASRLHAPWAVPPNQIG